MASGKGYFATPGFYLCAVFIISKCSITIAKSYLHTNEIVEMPHDTVITSLDLPQCSAHSICGYLQANARGINTQRRCACPLGERCPMTWDSADGHSVSQGSDQYKYCGAAPELAVCHGHLTAYTSRIVFSKETDEVILKSDHIHCICPESHNHVLSNQNFENPDDDTEAMELTYICAPLDVCQLGDSCKIISETATEFLVNRKCVCPNGLRCPTNASHGVKTTPYGRGYTHSIRCQH